MVVREHKIHVLSQNDRTKSDTKSNYSNEQSGNNNNKSNKNNNSKQHSPYMREEVDHFESFERRTSNLNPIDGNSSHSDFNGDKPYNVKNREYSKKHFAERRIYDCDKNGELHIRIEPLEPGTIRPATPVDPIPDYEDSHIPNKNKSKWNSTENSVHFSNDLIDDFDDDDFCYKKTRKISPEIQRLASQLTNASLKLPRIRSHSNGAQQKHEPGSEFQQPLPQIKINCCECEQCRNNLNHRRENSVNSHRSDNGSYGHVPSETVNYGNNENKSDVGGYSPRYRRHHDRSQSQRRARTVSPHCNFDQNGQQTWSHQRPETRSSNSSYKQHSPTFVDSGRSSATSSSFSPQSIMHNNTISYFSPLGPLKKVTRKSRLVSIHDGSPVSPFITKVYYEPLYRTNGHITMNPLYVDD